MSEENATYVTAEGRAALEAARKVIKGYFQDAPEKSEVEVAVLLQIDDALAMKSPSVDDIKTESYHEGYTACTHFVEHLIPELGLKNKILEMPEQIKRQSSTVADLTADIEKLRLSIANIKNRALELVLSATNEGKPLYSNDKARNMAVEQLLREDKLYLDNCDEIGRKECELRKEQIQLEYLHNQFSAYRAIAGMRGG